MTSLMAAQLRHNPIIEADMHNHFFCQLDWPTTACVHSNKTLFQYAEGLWLFEARAVACFDFGLADGHIVTKRHLRRWTFCTINAVGDERHCVFDRPHCEDFRQQLAELFQDSRDAMGCFIFPKDQKSVCALLRATLRQAHIMTDSFS